MRLLVVATLTGVAVLAYHAGITGYGTKSLTDVGRSVLTNYLSRTGAKVVESTSTIRHCFRNLPEIAVFQSKNHSHSTQAANRARAVGMMQATAQLTGRRLFMLQRSKRDEDAGIPGSRAYYWMKDTDANASSDTPTAKDIVGIVDTDYYMDMPYLLSHVPCPVMIYSMIPRSAGEVNSEGLSFFFDAADHMHATISGGATYSHPIWDYGVDVLTARRMLGLVTRTWNVDRRMLATHSGLMLLTPRHLWTGLASQLTRFLYGETLRRLRVATRGWVTLRVHTETSTEISVARVGSGISAAIPLELDEGLRSTVEVTKMPLTVSSVESQVARAGVSRAKAAMLCAYYRAILPPPQSTVFPVEYSVKRFQYEKYEPDAKASLMPYMSPLVNLAFAPDRTLGNEQRSIDKRIKEIAVAPMPITPEFVRYVDEFAAQIFPESGVLVPVDEEEVWEKQNRPSQRAILEEASCVDEILKRVSKTFMKAEAYGSEKDPRIISTINPKDKLQYSMVVYAMAEVLKKQHWYAFGRTPKEVAHRVSEICSAADQLVPNDISRMDGTVNNKCRHLEQAVYMRGFNERYHSEVLRIMKTQYKLKGIGMFGTVYATEYARLSGSPETSTSNSLDIAFVVYVAYRKMGYTPDQAYARLGIYGGDDGLSADIDPALFMESAKEMGFKLTIEVLRRGEPGVHFLARFYTPDVWYGDSNSCCDLLRQLSKFHTCSVSSDLDPSRKLVEKGFSYYLTDKNTPIIGEFSRRVKHFMDMLKITIDPTVLTTDKTYSSLATEDEQYPNEWHPWFEVHALSVVPGYDPIRFCDWLLDTRSLGELLHPPCLSDPDIKLSTECMINGEKETSPEAEWTIQTSPGPLDVTVVGAIAKAFAKKQRKEKRKKQKPLEVKFGTYMDPPEASWTVQPTVPVLDVVVVGSQPVKTGKATPDHIGKKKRKRLAKQAARKGKEEEVVHENAPLPEC